jgi:hypothetical protein
MVFGELKTVFGLYPERDAIVATVTWVAESAAVNTYVELVAPLMSTGARRPVWRYH